MKKIIIGLLLFFAALDPCFADSQGSATGGTAGTQSTAAGCVNQSVAVSAGQQATLSCDANGNLKITGTITASPQAAAAPAVSPSGAVTSLVLKASATTTGFQYACAQNGTAVTGYLIIVNAASAPSTGALTGVLIYQLVPANGYGCINMAGLPPIPGTVGITALLSSAPTPYTYTTSGSLTGSIVGLAQ